LRILLQDIPQGHSIIERREDPSELELESWCRPTGPLEVEIDVERREERLTLRGSVALDAEQDCARCAKPFRFRVESEILLLAERRGTDDAADEAALEQDGEVLYHDGLELELKGPLREALILEMPVVQLCRPDCRGLCPQCGKDLNEGTCSCAPSEGDPRWEALKNLKNKTS
jgi:uncharacterized protein